MTVQQLKTVIGVAEFGSLSAAAKALGLSQPNVSNSIKLLEAELGFPIFTRGRDGASLTKRGEQFLTSARQIVEESDKILSLKEAGEPYRLRVGTTNYYAAIEPFLSLCAAHREEKDADMCCYSVSVTEGIEALFKRALDVIAAPVLPSQVVGLTRDCLRYGLKAESVCKIPAVIIVRKGHPAIADGRLTKIKQGSDAMKDYPYAVYRNLLEDGTPTGYNDSDFIRSSYKIVVDEVDVRLRLVSSTDAFMFGVRSSKGMMERYGLAAFPVEGISAEMFVLTRAADAGCREIADYIYLLRKEMNELIK